MLAVIDTRGARLNLHMFTHAVAMIAASLLPALWGLAGGVYAWGALALGAAFLGFCVVFAGGKSRRRARAVVLASIVYLPLLMTLLMADKR